MAYRLLAVVGSAGFGIRQLSGSLLSLVGLRELARFTVPVLVVALAVGAITSARDTVGILASRPDVQESTLAAVASVDEPDGSVWFVFDALVAERHQSTDADLGTFFYLAVDPARPSTGLLVRSNLNDAFFRQRVITARLIGDESVVTGALDRLPPLPSGFELDTTRFLEELGSGGEAQEAFTPSELGEEPDATEVLVSGRIITPVSHAACAIEEGCDGDDAAWFYYLADPEGGGAIILRSPHRPDAIPVRLEGLYLRHTFDLRPVLDTAWYTSIDAEVPSDRAFFARTRPPIIVDASWVPTIIYAALALLLLASHLVGYPVFGGRARLPGARALTPGDGIDLEITGLLARGDRTLALDRSPGAIERLSIPALALRMWRYGLLPRDLSRRQAEERFLADAGGETDRLVVHERDQSALVTIARDGGVAEAEVGRLYRIGSSAPAVHLRQEATNAYLSVRDMADAERVVAEIRGEAEGRAR